MNKTDLKGIFHIICLINSKILDIYMPHIRFLYHEGAKEDTNILLYTCHITQMILYLISETEELPLSETIPTQILSHKNSYFLLTFYSILYLIQINFNK